MNEEVQISFVDDVYMDPQADTYMRPRIHDALRSLALFALPSDISYECYVGA